MVKRWRLTGRWIGTIFFIVVAIHLMGGFGWAGTESAVFPGLSADVPCLFVSRSVDDFIQDALSRSLHVASARLAFEEVDVLRREIDEVLPGDEDNDPNRDNERKQAQAEVERLLSDARLRYIDALLHASFQAEDAYDHVLRAGQLLSLSRHYHDEMEKLYDEAKNLLDAGLIPRLEHDEIEWYRDESVWEFTAAQSFWQRKVFQFLRMIGADRSNEDDEVIETCFDDDHLLIPSGIESLDEPNPQEMPGMPLHEAFSHAETYRMDMIRARREADEAHERWLREWYGKADSIDRQRAHLAWQRTEIELMRLRADVFRQLTEDYDEWGSKRQRVNLKKRRLALAQQRLAVAQARYEAGGGSLLDVVAAQVETRRAHSDWIEALWNERAAKNQLLRRMGPTKPPPLPADIGKLLASWQKEGSLTLPGWEMDVIP